MRQVTSYTYDIEHRLTRVETARGGTTQVRTFEYYSDGLLKKTVLPETGQTDYTYDANKRLETKIDARLRKTAWEYDQYGRVKIVRRYLTSGASQDIADERVEYYYDAAPAVFHDGTPVPLPSGVGFTASNILGRLVMTRTGASRILELYSYTAGGQIKQKRLETEGHRLDVTYEYDANGRISTVTGPAGRKFKYSYNAAGKPSQLKEALIGGFPDKLHATAVFDGWGRLQSVGGMSYEYNAMGQLSRYTRGSYDVTYNYVNAQGVNDGRLASQTAGGVTTSYSYDFMGRLQSATRAGQWLQQYEFDGFGNLTKRNVTLPGQPPVVEGNYPVNAATNRRTGSGTYDAAGNHVWHPSVVYDTDNRMVPMVHEELRRQAHRHMRQEHAGAGFQTTELVNEVYLRLVDTSRVRWQDRAHFFAICAQLMRRTLVDLARTRLSEKRGGQAFRVTFEKVLGDPGVCAPDWVALDDALQTLEALDPRKCRMVELRFFGGLNVEETAEVLRVCPDTIQRDWRFVKSWLRRELTRFQKP